MAFGNNLKILRESKGLSRKEMAERLGITQAAYGNYEIGNREPKLDTLIKMAYTLSVTTDELLGMESAKLEKYVALCESVGIRIKLLPEFEMAIPSKDQPSNIFEGIKYDKIIVKDGITLYLSKHGGSVRIPQKSFIGYMDNITEEFRRQTADLLYDKIAVTFLSSKAEEQAETHPST